MNTHPPATSADAASDLAFLEQAPTYTNHLRALERLRANGRLRPGAGRRVAILTTFTIEPVANCLQVRAHLDGAPLDVMVCPPRRSPGPSWTMAASSISSIRTSSS